MNNVIIGTAGHVDHGKTSLIKALTGMDADRLKEEKERGITIELGFAYLTLSSGLRCGIIDVPGHEKFVRNMLAGAGSLDLALFVVAADEGMMPQSREHLEILSLLGLKRGIIAVTKTDVVEPDWLEMVVLDIRDEVRGTFLEGAQIIPVSAKTGDGIDTLKQSLEKMIEQSGENVRDTAPFRLQVDRVFSMDGFGTVVTGALNDGEIKAGAEVTLYPSMAVARARSLQVHSQRAEIASRGQRVAINLAGIGHKEIGRGCVLAAPNSMRNTDILDVALNIVKSTKRRILHASRLHLHIGTGDVTCKLHIMGDLNELSAGDVCYAQLRLDEPLAVRKGDRFVVRFYSPMETVGGGTVLDPNPIKRSKGDENALKMFKIKECGTLKEQIACFILDRSKTFPLLRELKTNPFLDAPEFDAHVESLACENEIFVFGGSAIHKDYLEALTQKACKILMQFHQANPLLEGMKREELRSKLLSKEHQSYFDAIVGLMDGAVRLCGTTVAHADFEISMSEAQRRMSEGIVATVFECGYSTPSLDELAAKHVKDSKTFKQTMDALVSQGVLVMLTSQILMHREFCDRALQLAESFGREFTLAEFRDGINSSRKYAVALLEYFDIKGITKKHGDFRLVQKKIIEI